MKDFIITRILKWIGGKMDGYKTYAGATGKALVGLGPLITGIVGILGIIFPDQGLPKMEIETALALISAGVFAISSGLASYGVGRKLEKAVEQRDAIATTEMAQVATVRKAVSNVAAKQ